jgi:hypothetical protein
MSTFEQVPLPCRSLWFQPRLEGEEGGRGAARSAALRARQLADVALAVYEAGGRAIHLPLEPAHPLVAVLRAALGVGARGDLKVGLKLVPGLLCPGLLECGSRLRA